MLSPISDSDVHGEWHECLGRAGPATRRWVTTVVEAGAEQVADRFYAAMLDDPRAGTMLDHEVVNRRLHGSMVRWLRQLFDPASTAEQVFAVQRKTGEVHARIGVSIELLARGAREVKRALTLRLAAAGGPPRRLAEAIAYVYELIDLALGLMGESYAQNADRQTRADEAYRLFFLSQDLAAERERQRSRLLEWAHQILVRNYWEAPRDGEAVGSGGSEFSLWLEHKASILFDGAPEIGQIRANIAVIDGELLPRLARARAEPDAARAVVGEINQRIGEVKALLAAVFDRFTANEDGRDGVTPRLLNRRYFPSVAKREIGYAQTHASRFALLLFDIDAFEAVRESLGAAASDAVLAAVGDVLADHVRAGDFVFRLADDQFLVLLVDVDEAGLAAVADALRRRIERLPPRAGPYPSAPVTVCVGGALFDGHPDYQRLLERAQAALRRAQLAGANRLDLAG